MKAKIVYTFAYGLVTVLFFYSMTWSQLSFVARAFGGGSVTTLLFFPLAYGQLSRRLDFNFSNLKIIGLFLPTALCIGIIQLALVPVPGRGSEPLYISIFSMLGVPIIVSAVVIFVANKASSKKTQPEQNR